MKEGLGLERGSTRKFGGWRLAPLAGSLKNRYIGHNLSSLIRSRIESGPSGTRSFLLPERTDEETTEPVSVQAEPPQAGGLPSNPKPPDRPI
jgi:hypothetical protein